ncbi:MAG: molybdopterin dehydrogenase, FAD-binding [Pedosphaera sp.]|nr:molybdopterin dehydrogenase, FAD-binding [Pedosphaera sp.]
MDPFTYVQVQDNGAAISAARGGEAKFVAGGTNLIDLMKMGVERPRRLIDINPLPLQKIELLPDGTVRIGALVRNSDMAYDATIRKRYPFLSEALLSGASAQLRNMATVGGNLMQRTRCPYFYDTVFACNKRVPGAGCAAMDGYNRNHAVLGTSDKCIAAHPSDMAVALVALDATVRVAGPRGERTIPMADFHLLPGETPERETALEPGELITAVDVPDVPFAVKSRYVKVRDRASYEFALVSVAAALAVESGTIRAARVALGGVGTKPWRSAAAEKILVGAPANKETCLAAAEAAFREARPHKYNAFKVEMGRRALAQTLATVGGMA